MRVGNRRVMFVARKSPCKICRDIARDLKDARDGLEICRNALEHIATSYSNCRECDEILIIANEALSVTDREP